MTSRFATFALALTLTGTAWAAPFAYVPNEGSGTLSVIDTANDRVVAEIPAGKKPRGTVVSNDGKWAYVSDQPNNQLTVIDLGARALAGTVALGESPEGVGISPDGRWVAAAVEESNDIVFVDSAPKRARRST
jgi:YVTN family beta-propeller protein